ncbi:MAG: T9SS type A sorting domain-containing protein [Candidatus Cloacimonetes bacterium]|nr:T9SS type A sorting domain-containing protein [Candidatus Cloacimonadota bacterium]MDY0171511.1 FlgD immunoglobulin-like domain containing protein [Candidatus Cloacimonadaceae bacterium]
MKKLILLFTLSLLLVGMAWGQGLEDFTNLTVGSSYVDGSFEGNDGITWSYVASRDDNGDTNNSGIALPALMLRRVADNSKVTSSTISGGIGDFSVKLYKGFTGKGNRQVELFVNNVSMGTSVGFNDYDEHIFLISGINVPGDIIIEIRNVTSTQVIVDNIEWTGYAGAATPTINVVSATPINFTYVVGDGPSVEQSFELTGSDLTDLLLVSVTSNYEISSTSGGTFGSSLSFTPTSGSVSKTIYVHQVADLAIGTSYTGTVTCSSTDADDKTVSLSGEVTTPPAPDAPVATDATATTYNSFTANWDAVDNATGYKLDVYQSSSASGALAEGFEGYLTDTPPTDWTLSSTGSYIQNIEVNAHDGTYYAGMNRPDGWVQTPIISDPTSCSFWARTSAASANYTAKVQSSPDGTDWTDQATYTATPTDAGDVTSTYTEKYIDLNLTGDYYLRWVITARSGGSFYFDDVSILCNQSSATYVTDFQDLDVSNVTSYEVTGLSPETTYYYVVRAYDAYAQTSPNSNEIEVSTKAPAASEIVINGDGTASGATIADGGTIPDDLLGPDTGIPAVIYTITSTGIKDVRVNRHSSFTGLGWYCWLISSDNLVLQADIIDEYTHSHLFEDVNFDAKGEVVVIMNDNPTLPVELSSFTVALNTSNQAVLTWVTQTETGVSGFYIYRNTEGDLADALLISSLIPATNSSQQQVYIYKDKELNGPGTYYYWLQIADLNGSESFHGPLTLVYEEGNDQQTPVIPKVTELKKVFPNPFNPSATISYALVDAAPVSIRIYNSRGQLVRSFEEGLQNAGNYNLAWNGDDNSGRSLATGVYYIRMQAGNQSFNKKAVLMK